MEKSNWMKPSISIIIPVYNAEPYLVRCLDSVLKQSWSDFEAICINDGSTDESLSVLESYEKRDKRIKVYSQKNGGLSAARNAGIAKAQGEYLAFLDSDDFLAENMLERALETAYRFKADIVIFDYWLYKSDNDPLETYRDQSLFETLDGTCFSFADAPCLAGFIGVWDRIFRRDFIEENGFVFPVGRIYEDVPFCVETELAASRIGLIRDHLYYYRRSNTSSITANESRNKTYKKDFLYVQSCAQNSLRGANAPEEAWRSYTKYFFEYATMHQRQISDRAYFKTFFREVHKMSKMEMLLHGDVIQAPTSKFYWKCQKINNATLAFVGLKGVANQLVRMKTFLRGATIRKSE